MNKKTYLAPVTTIFSIAGTAAILTGSKLGDNPEVILFEDAIDSSGGLHANSRFGSIWDEDEE